MQIKSVIESLQQQVNLLAIGVISERNLYVSTYEPDKDLYVVTYAVVALDGESAWVDAYMFANNFETAKDALEYIKARCSKVIEVKDLNKV